MESLVATTDVDDSEDNLQIKQNELARLHEAIAKSEEDVQSMFEKSLLYGY